jgi:outer membrane protein assembly factor BamB
VQYTPTEPGMMSLPPRSKSVSTLKRLMRAGFLALAVAGVDGCEHVTPPPPPFIGVLPQGSFERGDWTVDLDLAKGDYITRVDVRDKLVYVYTSSKMVVAYDRKAGTRKFGMQVPSPVDTLLPLVELPDMIVFPNSTELEVFDKQGQFQRSVPLPSPLRSDAVGEKSSIYFGAAGARGGLVEAYDLSRPYAPQQWEYLTRDTKAVTAGPAVSDGIVYSGSDGGEVDAVATENRAQVWDTDHGEFLAAGPITADLQIDDSGLYVASHDSKMYCINKTTGKLRWQYFAGEPLYDAPILTSDTVYQYVQGKGLAALDKNTGAYDRRPRWIHPTATQFLSQDEKFVYLLDPRSDSNNPDAPPANYIIAVDKQTGVKQFESRRSDFTVFGTNRKDSTIFAAFGDGRVMTIKPVLKAGVIGELVMVPVSDDRPRS